MTHAPADVRPTTQSAEASDPHAKLRAGPLLGALGVVYGDIGTSPLYAFRESLKAAGGAAGATEAAVLGILSLIFWALIVVVTLKYLLFVMRADNQGEGGIMALLALALPGVSEKGRRKALLAVGVAGAALLYGDGIITPAISVLSAVEGLSVATPLFEPYVVPIALVILVSLFAVQRFGSGRLGGLFGAVMVVYFATLAVVGAWHVLGNPGVLAAVNPAHALNYLFDGGGWTALVVLGSVFLAVTGAEALYADMGHFGRRPINLAWMALVWPSLTLSYLGQGALVLADPDAVENPFFLLAPDWGLVPLVILATMATVIASQAVISGLFSIVNQAVRTGLLPRLTARHTSDDQFGQIYMPGVNAVLAVAVVALVLAFGSSSALAAAFGIAVSGVMLVTTLLLVVLLRRAWGWPLPLVALVTAPLLAIEGVFIAANLLKVLDGGWVPVLVAAGAATLMGAWVRGTNHAQAQTREEATPTARLVEMLGRSGRLAEARGTAVFLTSDPEVAPAALLHNVKHNQVLHARNLLVSVVIEQRPRVPLDQRAAVTPMGDRFARVELRFGYREEPDVPEALAGAALPGGPFDPQFTSFFLNRRSFRRAAAHGLPAWQEGVFVAMTKAAADAASFYRLPPGRVVEMGQQLTI